MQSILTETKKPYGFLLSSLVLDGDCSVEGEETQFDKMLNTLNRHGVIFVTKLFSVVVI